MARRSRREAPPVCPVCGEDVPRGSLACPECGADHDSGWRLDAESRSVALPEDEFDYAEFVKEEFGTPVKPRGLSPVWWITAIILLVISAIFFLTHY